MLASHWRKQLIGERHAIRLFQNTVHLSMFSSIELWYRTFST